MIRDLTAFSQKQDAPVIIGEFGSEDKQNTADRVRHAAYLANKAYSAGIKCFWWDCGHFALFDRHTEKAVQPEIIQALTALN